MKLAISTLTLALALAAVDAFRVDVSDVAPPADILGEHQELERTFKIYSEDALEKISVAIAGPVFIAYTEAAVVAPIEPATPATTSPEPTLVPTAPTVTPEPSKPEATTPTPTTPKPTTPKPTTPKPTTPKPTTHTPVTRKPAFVPVVNVTQDGSEDGSSSSSSSGSSDDSDSILFPADAVALHAASHKEKLVATVTITGNSTELLQLVEIVKDEHDGVRLTYKNKDAFLEGFVLTQIDMADKHTLRAVASELASVVSVASNVFSQDKKQSIEISSDGAGNVFVSEEGELTAKSLTLDVAGSGSIQLVAGSLKIDGELSTSLAGSGSLAVHADSVETSELQTSVSGSGALYVIAKTLTASELTGSVYGSAFTSIIATESGKVESEKLTVAGSGAVYAGSLLATKSNVDVWGSGQAYVQVTDKLKTSASYSGQVYYVGAKPATVKTSGWFFWRSSVKPAEVDKVVTHDAVAAPRVYPVYVAVELKEARHAHEPRVKIVDGAQGLSLSSITTHLSQVAHGPNGFLIFGSVVVALAAIAMAAQSYQQHRVRRHYTPLV